jgi:Iap family predicted aminopeptidase
VIKLRHIIALFLLCWGPAYPKASAQSPNQTAVNNQRATFDEQRAFRNLLQQTRFGPREPGSPGHARCLKHLREELNKYSDIVNLQSFSFSVPGWKTVQLTNIVASVNARATTRIFVSAHWDTRPWADQDPDPKNRALPIPGANDGASGVAVILELARCLKQAPPAIGVDLVLFDGEDVGKSGFPETFSVGSRHLARNRPQGFTPLFGVNIDMIGDRNLDIYREQNSERLAPQVQSLVFSTARRLNLSQFIDTPGSEITDDHLPMNEIGIPTVDLIDFRYPDESNKYWHTMADTPDKCSPESLAAVGRLLLEIIYSHQETKEPHR